MNVSALSALHAAFKGKLLTEPTDMAPYLLDVRGRIQGQALAVVEPDTTQDVAAVVRWCVLNNVPIVAQSGNTGLSGGATPDASGRAIVLSTKRLNRIRAVDPLNNTLTVEAGVVLKNAQDAAQAAHRLFPLRLASEGSCTIGGNLATNAGGVHVLRYGNARALCLGLEVVTAQGDVWDGLRALRKDNTGYDLRDLFIGSEGTLGIITAAVLKLYPLPTAKSIGWVAVRDPEDALALLTRCQTKLGDALAAFELLSEAALLLVLKHFSQTQNPLTASEAHPWHVLLEVVSHQSQIACDEALQAVLQEALAQGEVQDAALAASEAQAKAMWTLREGISEAQRREGRNIKHDIAVPISQVPAFLRETDALLEAHFGNVRMVTFGHLGDGNLHYNVSRPQYGLVADDNEAFLEHQKAIHRLVHDQVAKFHGSISAEHGLGTLRRDEAARYKSEVELGLMRSIKCALDPQGLMNPGKVLPVRSL